MSRTTRLSGDKTEHALFMQMVDGYKAAASACRQLSTIQLNPDFQGLAFMTEHIAEQAARLATGKAMAKFEREGALNRFSEVMGSGKVNA